MGGHQSHITRLVQWRFETLAPQMLGHDERHHALEHGYLNGLPFAGPLAMKERREHALHHHQPGCLVGNDGGQVAWLTLDHTLQDGNAAGRLNGVIQRPVIAIGACLAIAIGRAVDDGRVDRPHLLVIEA